MGIKDYTEIDGGTTFIGDGGGGCVDGGSAFLEGFGGHIHGGGSGAIEGKSKI